MYKNGLPKPFLAFPSYYRLGEYTVPKIGVNEGKINPWIAKKPLTIPTDISMVLISTTEETMFLIGLCLATAVMSFVVHFFYAYDYKQETRDYARAELEGHMLTHLLVTLMVMAAHSFAYALNLYDLYFPVQLTYTVLCAWAVCRGKRVLAS